MYDKIYNCATGRWVKTNGKVGKQIISKMIGGGGNQSAGASLGQARDIAWRRRSRETTTYDVLSDYIGDNVYIPEPESKLHKHDSDEIKASKQAAVEAVFGTREEFNAKMNRDINFAKGIDALIQSYVLEEGKENIY